MCPQRVDLRTQGEVENGSNRVPGGSLRCGSFVHKAPSSSCHSIPCMGVCWQPEPDLHRSSPRRGPSSMQGAFSRNCTQSNELAAVGATSGCPFAPWAAPRGGSERAASGVHPPLAAPSTTPALSPSHYWPRAREAAYDISSTSEQISHLPHRWR